MLNLLTLYPVKDIVNLVNSGKGFCSNGFLNNRPTEIVNKIKEFINDNIGLDCESPVTCIYKLSGDNVDLKNNGLDIPTILPSREESVMFQFICREDSAVIIPLDEFLTICQSYSNSRDDFEKMLTLESLESSLTVATLIEEEKMTDYIAFIPHLQFKSLRFYGKLEKDWSTGKISLPGLEEVKLNGSSFFGGL